MSQVKHVRLSFLPIPALAALIAVIYGTVHASLYFEPPWLLPITNTLFITVVCLAVAWIAARNYTATGRIQVLLLGCGVLTFGIGGILAAFVRAVPGSGANLNVTIYNTGALAGAIFHFIAAIILLAGISSEVGARRKMFWLVLSYAGLGGLMMLLTVASLQGVIPTFFVQGVGPTTWRQGVLGTAAVLFAFSFLIFVATYWRNKEVFLYWYSCALALTAISLTAFLIESTIGSPLGWTGRCAQYLGGIYFLVAIITAIRSAHARRTSLDSVLANSMSAAEERFRALAENSPDAIRRFDRELKHVYVNAAGRRWHGKRADATVGKTMEQAGIPEPYATLWTARIRQVFTTGQPIEVEEYLPTESGSRFYQSQCVPEYGVDGSVVNVLVVSRDLTERKRAEAAVLESRAKLEAALASMTDAVFISDAEGRFIDFNDAFAAFHRFKDKDECLKTLAEYPDILEVYLADGQPAALHQWAVPRALRGETVTNAEYTLRRKDTGETWVGSYNFAPIRDKQGEIVGSVVAGCDITDRKRREEQIAKLSRLYVVLSRVNEAIVRAVDARALYAKVCRIVAERGGFPLVWIGEVEEGQVVPAASGGKAADYVRDIRVQVQGELGGGPTGTCIREGRPVVNDDFAVSPATVPWREAALRYGFRASAAFPLRRRGKTIGALTLYAGEPSAFDAEQVDLLEALSADLSYALDAFEHDSERRRAEERTRLLSEVTSQLLASDQPQRIVEALCRRVMEHLDCQVFFNFLVDEETGRLHLNACAGIPAEAAHQIEWLDYGVAVCGCAARDGCRSACRTGPIVRRPGIRLPPSDGAGTSHGDALVRIADQGHLCRGRAGDDESGHQPRGHGHAADPLVGLAGASRARGPGRQRGQEPVPGQHEPRAAHADERDFGHDRRGPAQGGRPGRPRLPANRQRVGRSPADALERPARFREDRVGQAGAGSGPLQPAADAGPAYPRARGAGQRKGPVLLLPHPGRHARSADGGPHALAAGAAQPGRQRHQVHRARRGRDRPSHFVARR
jgi:PAS domain S-box-containing protein